MKRFLFFVLFLLMFVSSSVYADDECFESDISSQDVTESILEVSSEADKLPVINARHAVVLDRYSKHILFGKKENEMCKMASTTKIMTALITIENSNLQDIVVVSKKAAQTGGSRLGLSTNDRITVENLLYGLMLKSGNDSAVALAEYIGGSVSNFANLMNKKAKLLKLDSTNFVTPHGLDDDKHFTSAFDLALLTDYALSNEVFSKIVKTKNYTILINGQPKVLNNTNELLGNFNGVYGVKTGFTNGANRCLVTACKQGDLDIICVVLGCDTKKYRTTDSIKLLNYIFDNFCLINVKDVIVNDFNLWNLSNKSSFFINKGISQNLDVYLNSDNFKFTHMIIKKSNLNNISTNIFCNYTFDAPIYYNSHIGNLIFKIDKQEFLSIEILCKNSVLKKNCANYLFDFFNNYMNFFNIHFFISNTL